SQGGIGGQGMSADTKASMTTQVYQVYIRASAQAIWDAITSSEWTTKYGYQGAVDFELRPGGAYQAHSTDAVKSFGLPDVVVDGLVEASHPPPKLVHTYRFLFSDQHKAEGFTRVTWDIEQVADGFCRLMVTHELDGAPIMAQMVSSKFSLQGTGGW